MRMKKILSIVLMLMFLTACSVQPSTVSVSTDSPVPTPDSVVLATPEVAETPIPLPTDTPVPTDTPEPTPEPTPTPIPYDADAESAKKTALMLDRESFTTVATRGSTPSLLKSPGSSDRIYPFRKQDGIFLFEWIVLDTVEKNDNTYYYVRAVGSEATGYLHARSLVNTWLTEPESTYAMLVRPNGIIYRARTLDSEIAGHANYDVVRVVGIDRGFACIITADGTTGYVELGQLQYLTKEQFDAYLHQSCETPEDLICDASFEEIAEQYVGTAYPDSAEFVYDLLTAKGFRFNEGYYRFYQKPFYEKTLYPQNLYTTDVYNSLLFKLFNSSGMQVTYQGQETEWAYIASYDDVQPGDLLFFSDPAGKGDAVVPSVEVILHGAFSGDVTGCGYFLGDGKMLTVENGVVTEHTISDAELAVFDCARRIFPCVTDVRAHLIESMISMIYDRLGTPYQSGRRVGDASYDCSGIICWVFRSFDYDIKKEPSGIPLEITAAAFGHLDVLYGPGTKITLADTGIQKGERDRIGELQRGDLVLLMNESRSKIGHIMIYLGNNTVIHSTRIEGRYRGTLIAKFRSHLQYLYASSKRIESITPTK